MTIRAGVLVQTIDESKRVLNALDRKEARVLVRTGGYGRTTERRLFRRRKGPSPVNTPPNAHAKGSQGAKDVRYAVTKAEASVTIGHIQYPRKKTRPGKDGKTRSFHHTKPVPQMWNEGGRSTLTVEDPKTGAATYSANFRPRPFRDRAYSPTYRFFIERLRDERL